MYGSCIVIIQFKWDTKERTLDRDELKGRIKIKQLSCFSAEKSFQFENWALRH